MVSFVEKKSEDLAESEGDQYIQFTRKHLARIYPHGLRTDSSNYNPIPHWRVGAQMVALNYQTWDKVMLFNEAMFAQNGRCGYVLKPDFLRKGKIVYDSKTMPNSPTSKPKVVRIRVISGQHIPKPNQRTEGEIVDPYVKIKVYGHPADKQTCKTKYVKNNGNCMQIGIVQHDMQHVVWW